MKKINLKETGSGLKKSFRTKSVRFGSYSSALIAVVIAVAVAFNLVISQIPEKYMSFDLSPGKLYTIGEKTEKLLSSLEEDVTLTVLAEESSADRHCRSFSNATKTNRSTYMWNISIPPSILRPRRSTAA